MDIRGDPIPISALEHFTYCERQSALILVDGVWIENEHTTRGTAGHRRADTPATRRERGRHVRRAMELWSEEHNLVGRADAVEFYEDGTVAPVEYKIGTRHGRSADIQLCAQALCLEEMFAVSVGHGFIWYGATRRRTRVTFDETLRGLTAVTVRHVEALRSEPTLPAAPADNRCQHCQLSPHCLPDLVANPSAIEAAHRALFV